MTLLPQVITLSSNHSTWIRTFSTFTVLTGISLYTDTIMDSFLILLGDLIHCSCNHWNRNYQSHLTKPNFDIFTFVQIYQNPKTKKKTFLLLFFKPSKTLPLYPSTKKKLSHLLLCPRLLY